ncbi:MAG: hypothetical protein M0R17_05255 [Candidatus Omnitrophica bacterium]|nr:hypothetical protein [Candidatus Omnitrophota bacterium]
MLIILCIGTLIAIINVILTYNEMLPFFKALKSLNVYTDKHSNIKNRMAYPFRFISILPKGAPIVLDVGVALAMGSIGMSGGVYGALIGLSIGFTASLLLKIHRHFISPRIKTNKDSWKLA